MKLKKLTCMLVITTFTTQSIVACVGNNSSTTSSSLIQKTNTATATGSLTDHRLWANITGYDAVSKDSQLDFSINNASLSDFELVGCDNDSTITNNLESNIEAGSIAQRTKKFDNQWLAYANSNGSMLDPKHIADNNLQFKGDNSSNRAYNCYYRIYHPEVNDFIYVKLAANEVTLPTNGAATRGQPDIDMEQLANGDVGEAVKSGKLSFSSYSKQLAWADQKNLEQSLISYTDKLINAGVQSRLNGINQSLLALSTVRPSTQLNGPGDFWLKRVEQRSEYTNRQLRYLLNLDSVGALPDYFKGFSRNANGNIVVYTTDSIEGYDLGDPQQLRRFERKYEVKVNNDNPVRVEKAAELDKDFELSMHEAPSEPDQLLEQNSVSDAWRERSFSDMTMHVSHEEGFSENSVASIEQMTLDQPGSELSETLGQDIRAAIERNRVRSENTGILIMSGFTIVTMVIPAIIMALVDYFSGKSTDGKGNEKSNMVMLKLSAPSASDISSWNASHDQLHQLGDTTSAVAVDPSDANGGNNSITQTMRFTFKDDETGRDQQLGNQINLYSISTPWLRAHSKEDPYIGDVSEGSPHQTDAVIGMDVDELSVVDDTKDASYTYDNQRLVNLGVPSLGQDLRFDAPTYNVQSITNTKTDSAIYKAGSNGGLFGVRSGLARINGIDGLVINSGQQTTLSVQIPTSSLSRLKNVANAGALSYGQGLGSNLVSYDDTDATTLTPVKSDEFLRHLQSVPESAVGSYFYNKFNCSYPLKVGDKCTFTMEAGGNMNGKKHLQKLYLADGNSKTTAIPVYVNYNLVSEPQSAMVNNGDDSPVKIVVKNFSNDPYTQIKVSGLPAGARLLSNSDGMPSCSSQLSAQQSCELSYDFSNVDSGSYSMVIYGINGSSNEVPSPDSANANGFNLTIQGGF